MREPFKLGLLLLGTMSLQTAWNWANPVMPVSQAQMIAITSQQIKQEIAEKEAEKILNGNSCPSDVPSLVAKASLVNGISVRVVAADILVESSCNPRAVSQAGAVGLLQVNPKVWKTGKNLFDPESNIREGTKILAFYERRYGIQNGLRHYFGCTPGSDASDKYANKVLRIAYAVQRRAST